MKSPQIGIDILLTVVSTTTLTSVSCDDETGERFSMTREQLDFVFFSLAGLAAIWSYWSGMDSLFRRVSDGAMEKICSAGFLGGAMVVAKLSPPLPPDANPWSTIVFPLCLGGVIGAFCMWVYFVPAYLAAQRNHHNALAISVLNLVAGWTFIGWLVALVWSLTSSSPRSS